MSSQRSAGSRLSNGQGFSTIPSLRAVAGSWPTSTVDSINSIAKWFPGGFTLVTGTETSGKDRIEVYNVSIPPYGRGGSNLIATSGPG
jgi:hypothetical protein